MHVGELHHRALRVDDLILQLEGALIHRQRRLGLVEQTGVFSVCCRELHQHLIIVLYMGR